MAKAEGLNTLLPGAPIQSGPLNQNFQILRDSVNTINASQLAPSSVENSKLAGGISADKLAGGITASKLADGTITSDKLSSTSPNQAVAESNIRDAAVTYSKIKFGEVYGSTSDNITRHIAAGTIGTVDLRDSAVTSMKIAELAVTTPRIADSAVTEVKVASNAVSESKIKNLAVTTAKIGDQQVTSTKIADNAVSTAKIGDQQVTSAKIANNAVTTAKVEPDIAQSLAPTGSILDFAGSSAPPGWLLCQGQAVSRSTYAALFAVIGTTYGTGNGSTTFNLPDYRGRVSAGWDTSDSDFNVMGKKDGAKTHTLTTAQMPSHRHDKVYMKAQGSIPTGREVTGFADAFASGTVSGVRAVSDGGSLYTGNTGSGSAHNNLQPYIVVNKIIKT